MTQDEQEQLQILLVLKHNSLVNLYNKWLMGDVKLDSDEMLLLQEQLEITLEDMYETKLKFMRAMNGIVF